MKIFEKEFFPLKNFFIGRRFSIFWIEFNKKIWSSLFEATRKRELYLAPPAREFNYKIIFLSEGFNYTDQEIYFTWKKAKSTINSDLVNSQFSVSFL